MMAFLADINAVANLAILALLVVTAIAVVRSVNLINATIFMGIFGMLMACEYLILAAPDVAITEAAVGAGFSTVLLLMALFMVGEKEKKSSGGKVFPFIIICAATVMLVYAGGQMPMFGASDAPSQGHIAAYYLEHSEGETGIPNVVTSILASYRGYDTLGETLVIFTAGIVVLMLLGRFKKEGAK